MAGKTEPGLTLEPGNANPGVASVGEIQLQSDLTTENRDLSSMSFLEIRNLRKSYGKYEALRGINLAVEEGEMFGLLGPNGAGKTTLVSILACLNDTSSGEIYLAGKKLDRRDLSLRSLIGIGTQDVAVYSDMTARENLAFFGKLYGLDDTTLKRRIGEVLEMTALNEKADQRAGTYSGGMLRRLNLGIAVMHRPRILYLDEPTTGVDPQSRNHLFEQIKVLNADGMTVIYTSHYMEEVQALCPRLAIMDYGQVIACDTMTALLNSIEGIAKVRVAAKRNEVMAGMAQVDGLRIVSSDGETISFAAHDLQGKILKVIEILRKLNVELTGLESQESNLERVFLHLTQRTLRD
jgi:ABC-2 type transport system ATP-binding protein